jgi:hypothetical protein
MDSRLNTEMIFITVMLSVAPVLFMYKDVEISIKRIKSL